MYAHTRARSTHSKHTRDFPRAQLTVNNMQKNLQVIQFVFPSSIN